MGKAAHLLLGISMAAPVVASVAVFLVAPDTMPMQVGFDGEVNRYGSKAELLAWSLLIILCNGLIAFCYAHAGRLAEWGMLNMPKRTKNPVRSARILLVACAVFCAVLWIGVLLLLLSKA